MVKVIKDTERDLPNKHLIAQQLQGTMDGPVDFSNDPDVDIIVSQYAWAAGDQMGGLKALDMEYGHRKAIELNETDYYPEWYGEGNDKVAASRVEAWEFIVGGGAGFNHLNGLYTVKNPGGRTGDNEMICRSLAALKVFMNSFDFIRMKPDRNFIIHGIPEGVFYSGMSEPGKQYSLYIHHGQRKKESYYFVSPGKYSENLVLSLPDGTYRADWINPEDGRIIGIKTINVEKGNYTLSTPEYSVDIALRIRIK